ncbi:MAG: hypothetical protein ACFE0I_03205 [Elainellaceae cyanobacterium]
MTLGNFNAEIERLRAKLEAYNSLLSQIDVAQAAIAQKSKKACIGYVF